MATHEELITPLKFDESFRNALRNYYSYGFKILEDYKEEEIQTLKNDWKRLNNILSGYLEWTEKLGKATVMFATQESSALLENPFHRLYRFCKFNHNDPAFFFNIIMALSDHITVPKQKYEHLYDSLGIDLLKEAKKRDYYGYIRFIKENQMRSIRMLRVKDAKPLAKNVCYLVSEDDSEIEGDKLKVAQKHIDIVEYLLEKLEDIKGRCEPDQIENVFMDNASSYLCALQVKENSSVKKYIKYITANIKKDISIIDEERYSYYLVCCDSNIIRIANKNEDYINELMACIDFIDAHEDVYLDIDNCIYGKKDGVISLFQDLSHRELLRKHIKLLLKNADKKRHISKEKTYTYIWFEEKKDKKDEKEKTNSILISHKDEKYVKTLFFFWFWINQSDRVFFDKEKNVLFCKVGDKTKKLNVHSSNIDELQMVKKLVEGKGKIEKYEEAYLGDMEGYLQDCFKNLEYSIRNNRFLSSSQLQCFCPSDIGLFTGDNTSINGRLKALQNMGILRLIIKDDEKQSSEELSQIKATGNLWSLTGCSLREILNRGEKNETDNESAFSLSFQAAIDFYSKYFVLGILGTFILDRMNRLGNMDKSPFRFKHEYFMQSLNDFILVDILDVIEKGMWCEIQYKHGTADFCTTILCKPLEIRISATTGREYLIFYNPIKRSCTNLRLEFVENIVAYDEETVLGKLEELKILRKDIKVDIEKAYGSLKYMWGVSFAEEQEDNVLSLANPRNVKINISYNPQTEYYIANRLLREARSISNQTGVSIHSDKGIISFGACVADPKEMRPWIRSLYSRILDIDGIEKDGFSIVSDIEKCISGMEELTKEKIDSPNRWLDDTATIKMPGKGNKVRKHEELFNEVFSVYYYIIAEIILTLCSEEYGRAVSQEEIMKVVNRIPARFRSNGGISTSRLSREEIQCLLKMDAFGKSFKSDGKKKSIFKYKCSSDAEFYKDIFPLTTLEIRWLKTILTDTKMKCFLDTEQINALQELLEKKYPDINPLPVEHIKYFDRRMISGPEKKQEYIYVNKLTEAINRSVLVNISFTTRKGKKIEDLFKPIIIEFSKRNNKFQVQLQSNSNSKFYTINLTQIESILLEEKTFEYDSVLDGYKEYRKKTQRSVQIQFYDDRNMADRILTEFSPWKKYCEYDRETQIYTLQLFYQKDEELDLVVRLMGYGGSIYFVNKDQSIAREILRRYEKQRSIILERARDTERGE